ncbi:GlxA family transcriptional regulator [Chromobacterium phragmitis]|uniref:AraC family transcriptional regulator n=1 Tax=Chromobacterium phragmitis TaxID=2202141 RepID=A0A344UH94_9NEIS|nr:helix-turn-helix domain-containing protein [Chromobacterium phragmitis]AXE34642.1 AraC family transcriptional regulator [Chromobacterium phragmitis]
MKDIVFFIHSGFDMLDLAGPLCAFRLANCGAAVPPYRLRIVSVQGGLVPDAMGLLLDSLAFETQAGAGLDTLLVAGGPIPDLPDPGIASAIQALSAQARRSCSVCTGAFLLAAAGLLSGRRATTHWRHAPRLQREYPDCRVDGDKIFVQDGPIWTSAGISAGIDLAIALIEDDLGSQAARQVSREMVVYHRRPSGQSQFSEMDDLCPQSDRLRAALAFLRAHIARDIRVGDLAAAACLGERQFNRLFRQETGETPARAIERLRVEIARARLASGKEPIAAIARAAGFHDPERMRRAFLRQLGQTPQAYRRQAARERGETTSQNHTI